MASADTSPPQRRKHFARLRGVLTYIFAVSVIFGTIVVPLYMSGWRFTTWLRDVMSIIWPLGALSSFLAFIAARQYRKAGDHDQAFRWMSGAAVAALLGLLMLWLTVRDKL